MDKDRETAVKVAKEMINKLATTVVENLDGPELDAQLHFMKDIALNFCKVDEEWSLEKKVLDEFKQQMCQNESEDFRFEDVYNEIKKNKSTDTNLKEHLWYKEFENKLETLIAKKTGGGEEEELVGTEVVQTYKDPFTKQIMQHPMKNLHCGHSYDKIAVICMLKTNRNLMCPYPLCNARVVQKDLVMNEELLEEIKASQNC